MNLLNKSWLRNMNVSDILHIKIISLYKMYLKGVDAHAKKKPHNHMWNIKEPD